MLSAIGGMFFGIGMMMLYGAIAGAVVMGLVAVLKRKRPPDSPT